MARTRPTPITAARRVAAAAADARAHLAQSTFLVRSLLDLSRTAFSASPTGDAMTMGKKEQQELEALVPSIAKSAPNPCANDKHLARLNIIKDAQRPSLRRQAQAPDSVRPQIVSKMRGLQPRARPACKVN